MIYFTTSTSLCLYDRSHDFVSLISLNTHACLPFSKECRVAKREDLVGLPLVSKVKVSTFFNKLHMLKLCSIQR